MQANRSIILGVVQCLRAGRKVSPCSGFSFLTKPFQSVIPRFLQLFCDVRYDGQSSVRSVQGLWTENTVKGVALCGAAGSITGLDSFKCIQENGYPRSLLS